MEAVRVQADRRERGIGDHPAGGLHPSRNLGSVVLTNMGLAAEQVAKRIVFVQS